MTGLEKLYNIVLKEQNVLNSSIYAWNSQRDYNMTRLVWMNYGGLSM